VTPPALRENDSIRQAGADEFRMPKPYTDDGGIDDQIFEVRIIGHRLEDAPPNTFDAPSTKRRSTLFQDH
jgi:hypothetical protein